MQQLRKHTDRQLDKQRYQAELTRREMAVEADRWLLALDRAGELALAGDRYHSRRVLEVALAAK